MLGRARTMNTLVWSGRDWLPQRGASNHGLGRTELSSRFISSRGQQAEKLDVLQC